MWGSVALTLAGAAGNNIGKVLQKKGTLLLPPISFKLKAPVSVVQPIAGCGLAMLCVFSHFYLKEVVNGLDWVAITLAGLGTIVYAN